MRLFHYRHFTLGSICMNKHRKAVKYIEESKLSGYIVVKANPYLRSFNNLGMAIDNHISLDDIVGEYNENI